MRPHYQILWAPRGQHSWLVTVLNDGRNEKSFKRAVELSEAVEVVAQKIDILAQVDTRRRHETKIVSVQEFCEELYKIRDDESRPEVLRRKAAELVGTQKDRIETTIGGSVIDHIGELVYTLAPIGIGKVPFATATMSCEMRHEGVNEWRLPSRWELESLLSPHGESGTMSGPEEFRDESGRSIGPCWTTDKCAVDGKPGRYVVDFSDGTVSCVDEDDARAKALPVRERKTAAGEHC